MLVLANATSCEGNVGASESTVGPGNSPVGERVAASRKRKSSVDGAVSEWRKKAKR